MALVTVLYTVIETVILHACAHEKHLRGISSALTLCMLMLTSGARHALVLCAKTTASWTGWCMTCSQVGVPHAATLFACVPAALASSALIAFRIRFGGTTDRLV